MILVLNKNGEDSISTIEKPVKRKFLILIGQSNNTYKLVSQNENLIYFYGYDLNFKDAFVDVNIEKGRFTIDHYGGFAHRWGRSTAFEYYPPIGNWFLFDDEYSIMDASNTEEPNKLISEQKINSDAYGKIQVDKFDLINSAINIQIQTDDIAAQFSHFIKQFKLLQSLYSINKSQRKMLQ